MNWYTCGFHFHETLFIFLRSLSPDKYFSTFSNELLNFTLTYLVFVYLTKTAMSQDKVSNKLSESIHVLKEIY